MSFHFVEVGTHLVNVEQIVSMYETWDRRVVIRATDGSEFEEKATLEEFKQRLQAAVAR